ncbi:unnamed protein product [Urochloa decumbens]|uniref:FBD domain-containing protein n=1 Tax=Urochloa decumbens TaxID=240449 RepID=A0ABC9GED2_9POAL
MAMPPGAKRRRRLDEDEEEELADRISRLPDGILGDIVSFLPTKDGARTQLLSSRWRPIWRAAPLNLDLPAAHTHSKRIRADEVSRILSAHQGPGRRFCTQLEYLDPGDRSAALDRWLRCPALDKLQELEIHLHHSQPIPPPPPLPASVLRRFSSTLRAASFGGCSLPEGSRGSSPLQFPLLKQLTLLDVTISEASLSALLAACPVLESLLLTNIMGCSRFQIVSLSLRSIGLRPCYGRRRRTNLQQLIIIKDAPHLERFLCFETGTDDMKITVSVISAPRLHVLALLCVHNIRHDAGSITFQFASTSFQRSCIVSLMAPVHCVKVLALTQQDLCLDMVINFLKCFPCLEKLYIKTHNTGEKNVWHNKYKNLIGTLEIRLKKIVLRYYRGNASHVNFAKFFVLNARMLQSMKLDLLDRHPSNAWIERQHGLLQIKNKASRGAQFEFVSNNSHPLPFRLTHVEQVHDLSTADPFVRFHDWI